jgi:hypothetical protein
MLGGVAAGLRVLLWHRYCMDTNSILLVLRDLVPVLSLHHFMGSYSEAIQPQKNEMTGEPVNANIEKKKVKRNMKMYLKNLKWRIRQNTSNKNWS